MRHAAAPHTEEPAMKFAMFYEIPVAKPWGKDDEYNAY